MQKDNCIDWRLTDLSSQQEKNYVARNVEGKDYVNITKLNNFV